MVAVRSEARRIDEDQGGPPLAERPLQQPLDEQRRQRGCHHGQLERTRDDAPFVAEQGCRRRVAVRLGRSEEVVCLAPVGLVRMDPLKGPVGAVDEQDRAPPAPRLRQQ